MAVKKGLKGLLNQGSHEMLAAMQRDPQNEDITSESGGGVGAELLVSTRTGPSTAAAAASHEPAVASSVAESEPTEAAPVAAPAAPSRQKQPHSGTVATASPAMAEETVGEESASAPAPTAKKPSWEEMDRKEVRVYSDQVLALTTLRLRINKGKKGSERITDNTLIRTAIDLLLKQQDEIGGVTENEIRASCGLDPRY